MPKTSHTNHPHGFINPIDDPIGRKNQLPDILIGKLANDSS